MSGLSILLELSQLDEAGDRTDVDVGDEGMVLLLLLLSSLLV